MKRLTAVALLILVSSFAFSPAAASTRNRRAGAHSAKCTGSTPCRACKNCRYCKHCAEDGGKCGVCRKSESSQRTWQTAADEQAAARIN